MSLVKSVFFIVGLVLAIQVEAANDPTRPPFMVKRMPSAAYEPLKLSMILSEGDSRRAIINESVVAVSDYVAGAKVLKINEDSVLVRRSGKQIKLSMPLAKVRKDGENE